MIQNVDFRLTRTTDCKNMSRNYFGQNEIFDIDSTLLKRSTCDKIFYVLLANYESSVYFAEIEYIQYILIHESYLRVKPETNGLHKRAFDLVAFTRSSSAGICVVAKYVLTYLCNIQNFKQ